MSSTTYINGKVYTVDKARPWAEAFTVNSSGQFTAVGTSKDRLSDAHNQGHYVVDLQEKFIMPGIHDAHTHLLAAALQQLYELPIGMDVGHENMVDRIQTQCQCSQAHGAEEWLLANFYNGSLFPNGCHSLASDRALTNSIQNKLTGSTSTKPSLIGQLSYETSPATMCSQTLKH